MITVKSKNITTAQSKPPPSNILKIFFITFQIIFGYDFGFIKYKSTRHKIIVKLCFTVVPFVSGIAFILFILPDFQLTVVLWYSIFVVEKFCYILTLLLAPEQNTFKKFLQNLQWIDSELKVNHISYYFELKVIFSSVITLLWETCLGINILQNFSTLGARITYFSNFSPIVIPFVVFFFVFRATNIRLVALRKLINDEPKQAQILYKFLIDSVESVKQPFNSIFLVTLCANIPSTMTVIYHIIKDVKTIGLHNLHYHVINLVTSAVFLLTLFAPALAAGKLCTEVETIKIMLQDAIVLEEDENRVQDIKRFLKYIEARPFKLRLLRIIPLDASFVVMSLNFSVTYLIVILQLTHIY